MDERSEREREDRERGHGGRERKTGREGSRERARGGRGGVATVQRPRITHHAKIGCEIRGVASRTVGQ